MSNLVLKTDLPFPVRSGKVRDVYDFGSEVLLVSTDRISAFDWILPSGIPDKGRVLTQISAFWFDLFGVENHKITCDVNEMPQLAGLDTTDLVGRSMLCKKTKIVPMECIVRGYLTGSGWKEYQKSGTVCGIELPKDLKESAKLENPIFTPSTKAEEGHDENITFEQMADQIGVALAEELRERSLEIFLRGSEYAEKKGILIADTKFEWGVLDGRLILSDEVLTPDSSRFWPADQYAEGRSQPSFDKQFVRDWLTNESGWDKNSPPPALPQDVVDKTRAKYIEAYERLTDKAFPWK